MAMLRVLIPLDGSKFSRQILRHVRTLLSPEDNELILLRVGESPEGISGAPARPATSDSLSPVYESERDIKRAEHPIYTSQAWDSVQAALVNELQAEVNHLQGAGYAVSVAVRFGNPAQEIVDFVEQESVDLIAMTTHGRSGLGRLIFGSVADRVLRNVSVPVLLLRPFERPADAHTPGEVLAKRLAEGQRVRVAVATDGSAFAQVATAFAGDLARGLGAEVSLLAAAHEDVGAVRVQEIFEEARGLLGNLEPAPASVPLIGYADEEIIRHLAKEPADLLVIGAFGDRGATRFQIGTTACRLVMHAPTSVLVVKDRPRALRRLLVCTDVGDDPVVEVAGRLAKAVGAELRVLHVIGPSAAMYLTLPDVIDLPLDEVLAHDSALARHLTSCVNQLEALGLDGGVVKARRGPLPDTIFQEARDGAYDLIVVGSQAGPVRNQYWIGSIADRVARYAHRPVLVVRTARQ